MQEKQGVEISETVYIKPYFYVGWSDGTSTRVKCKCDEEFDPEKGLAMAFVKKFYYNNGDNFYDAFKKWIPENERLSVTAKDYMERVHNAKKRG